MHDGFIPRFEDHRLLTGAGRFLDDERAAGAAHGVFARSPHAFAAIRAVDVAPALAVPGVIAVLTAADLAREGTGDVNQITPVPGGADMVVVPHPVLCGEMVRHVGDPVALVVAETAAAARDGAEAVAVDYDALEPVADLSQAVAQGAPLIWPQAPGNVAVDWRGFAAPDPTARAALDNAFATAAHVARVRLVNQRIVMAPMEPRGALAEFDGASGRYTLYCATQSAIVLRHHLAASLGVAGNRVRVVTGDVGGAFGMRTTAYPEYAALLVGAKRTGRAVRWLSTRSEGFLTDNQARDTVIEARLALDAEGKFLAIDIDELAAMGAYLTSHGPFIATANFARCLPGMYDIPRIGLRIRCVFTNTVPTGPYRGAGRPEANYCMERLIDAAARDLAIDPVELRRRNLIAPSQLPYKGALGTVFDSGEFAPVIADALKEADAAGFPARRAESEAAGKRRGLGVGCFLEIAGGQPGEGARLAFPGESKLLLAIGIGPSGQGHATLYRRMTAERLGIPVEQVDLTHGDSDSNVPSAGAVASRSTMSVGSAVYAAVDAVIEKGRRAAAQILEAAEADIGYRDGVFEISGTDRRVSLFDVAEAAEGAIGQTLDTQSTADALPSFPNGCHVAEIEIDPETGFVTLLAYTAVDDCGRVLQPVLVEGQVHGGVAQGVGQVLMEHGVYDPASGQLLAGSFMDYAMPRADDLPPIASLFHPVPSRRNPLGVKGVGEAGTTAALAAVMNAIVDALPRGAKIDMPATPEAVWRACRV
ncbi:MAG TPA: xanthine dehydrogenase family protein molybdopterin-binding subunit [Stellaceae bacterium]|jgi:carbon-monoxide dehydrogenase large subunit|nr:xanthine dehydrogenase family protein molybdopterin-binding subunit [Stellaceae bacterium]